MDKAYLDCGKFVCSVLTVFSKFLLTTQSETEFWKFADAHRTQGRTLSDTSAQKKFPFQLNLEGDSRGP
jgi:hypothetical protein